VFSFSSRSYIDTVISNQASVKDWSNGMSIDWSRVKESDVKEACSRYDADEKLQKRSARNTFLILDGRRYPAKFIRGLAYEIATGDVLDPNTDYTGGVETLNFFRALGFTIEYKGELFDGVRKPNAQADIAPSGERTVSSPKAQRYLLKNLLEQRFGSVETEAKFDWLTVPDQVSTDDILNEIYETLVPICGRKCFSTPGYRLACDFFVSSKNLIIEYDERQHFTIQRAESLSCYPSDLYVGFDINEWRKSCESIRAVDIDPIYRDEQRAFYDSTRDILAARNGMTLIRIKHGDVDWNTSNSQYELDRLLSRYIKSYSPADSSSGIRDVNREITEILKRIEYYLQEIRVCYLRWVTHESFTPPKTDIAGIGTNGDYIVLDSPNGRAFTLSPCGFGSCYVGAPKGSVGIPDGCYPDDEKLKGRTAFARGKLSDAVKSLKERLLTLIDQGRFGDVWGVLQDYYWIKLGIHEFAYDVAFCAYHHSNPVRELLVDSIRRGEDLRLTWHKYQIEEAALRKFIIYSFAWNRYACCAFDCGPITLSRNEFVHFSDFSEYRRKYEPPADGTSTEEKRKWAKGILKTSYDLLLCYDEPPLVTNERYRDLAGARPEIVKRLCEVEQYLQERENDMSH